MINFNNVANFIAGKSTARTVDSITAGFSTMVDELKTLVAEQEQEQRRLAEKREELEQEIAQVDAANEVAKHEITRAQVVQERLKAIFSL